jgi:hypothetical protein
LWFAVSIPVTCIGKGVCWLKGKIIQNSGHPGASDAPDHQMGLYAWPNDDYSCRPPKGKKIEGGNVMWVQYGVFEKKRQSFWLTLPLSTVQIL